MAANALGPAGREYQFEDSIFTFFGKSTMTTADVGKVVMIDTSVTPAAGEPPTVKLTTDGGEIFGRIEAVEVRAQEGQYLVSVALRFIGNVPMKSGETPAPGAQMIGYTGGAVKTRTLATVTDTGVTGVAVPLPFGQVKTCIAYNYDATALVANIAFGI